MTAIEREFLAKAYEVQEHLRPRASPDRIVPLLSWRTIGVLCHLSGEKSDELVRQLAAADCVRIVDAEKRLIMLSTNSESVCQEVEARKQRRRTVVGWGVGALCALLYWIIRGFVSGG